MLKISSFTFISNLICVSTSVLATFILSKGICTEKYGCFQLYSFYAAYTGFLYLGWADALFLRHGDTYYNELDKEVF